MWLSAKVLPRQPDSISGIGGMVWWYLTLTPLNAALLTEEIFSNNISSSSKYIIVKIMYLSIDFYLSIFCKNYRLTQGFLEEQKSIKVIFVICNFL